MKIGMAMGEALAAALVLAGGVQAQRRPNTVPPDTCTAKAAPPPEMAAWTSPIDAPAATSEAGLAKATLSPGKAITADFSPVADVKYRVKPEKGDGPATFGGLYALHIAEAGTYRIASSAAPWMDVFVTTTPVVSTAHGHGPACTGIGKMVDFPLQPGDYLLQFSESLTPKAELMVVKLAQ